MIHRLLFLFNANNFYLNVIPYIHDAILHQYYIKYMTLFFYYFKTKFITDVSTFILELKTEKNSLNMKNNQLESHRF